MSNRPELLRPIMELTVITDWFGLWELYYDVARAVNATPDREFREHLRAQLGEMIDRDLIEAAIWSYDPPKPLTGRYIRELPLDSEFWESPTESTSDEQIRVSATESGSKAYHGEELS